VIEIADRNDHEARRAWAIGKATADAFKAEAPIKAVFRLVAEGDGITRPCCICGNGNAEAQCSLDTQKIHGVCIPCGVFTKRLELPREMRGRVLRWAIYNALAS
jgi:hypothetical protein